MSGGLCNPGYYLQNAYAFSPSINTLNTILEIWHHGTIFQEQSE